MKNLSVQNSLSSEESSTQTALSGENLHFIEDLYREYLEDPSSVDPSWKPVFDEYFGADGSGSSDAGRHPAFRARSIFEPAIVVGAATADCAEYVDNVEGITVRAPGRTEGFAARVEAIVRAYRLHGHLVAKIDPLGFPRTPGAPPDLDPATYGFTTADLKATVRYEPLFGAKDVTVGEVVDRLRALYCGSIGVEYQDLRNAKRRMWLREQIERHDYAEIDSNKDQMQILNRLMDADAFESFLHRKYVGAKRFSITGGDTLIPMIDTMLNEGGKDGVQEVVIGMAHRGRLNVLHNIMNKSAAAMFSEFEKNPTPEAFFGSSDVKYHMGYSSEYKTESGDEVHLSLCFNPSHLEFVNPVVLGRSRAKQDRMGGEDARRRLLPLLLHGDAAFAGQGIVVESLNLARVEGFDVGGTIHIVINNQIGFTTLPGESRSTTYSTDIAKMLEVPIFHVNGDDPEACARVMKLAVRYRQRFGEDVIIDLVCYRRYGHNEGDEPRYTQPVMYQAIDARKGIRELYTDDLVARKVVSREQADEMWDARMSAYDEVFKGVREAPLPKHVSSLDGLWTPYHGGAADGADNVDTTITLDELCKLGERLTFYPEGFNVHRTLLRFARVREQMLAGEAPFDWSMGEALAYASLVDAKARVRMSGQDAVRGTFSHRHAGVSDTETGESYWPLHNISDDQGPLNIYNSILSEAAVLGFEYGYSLDAPDALVIWEAQFGDFMNGAQVLIDQFINSGEDKWKRLSGLTMLLPHGYEGQGPEHSSARLERFLQLCANENMYVVNLTTPSQIFHALRRQVVSPLRKPLIVMSPKSLLRHKEAVSSLEDFTERSFQRVISEVRGSVEPASVRRVLFCSGKVYYDLIDYAQENEINDVAVVRVEQIYPLVADELTAAVAAYGDDVEIFWVQEEPKNMGAWSFMFPNLIEIFGSNPLPKYVGRVAGASPATGAYESHEIEQRELVVAAFAK